MPFGMKVEYPATWVSFDSKEDLPKTVVQGAEAVLVFCVSGKQEICEMVEWDDELGCFTDKNGSEVTGVRFFARIMLPSLDMAPPFHK